MGLWASYPHSGHLFKHSCAFFQPTRRIEQGAAAFDVFWERFHSTFCCLSVVACPRRPHPCWWENRWYLPPLPVRKPAVRPTPQQDEVSLPPARRASSPARRNFVRCYYAHFQLLLSVHAAPIRATAQTLPSGMGGRCSHPLLPCQTPGAGQSGAARAWLARPVPPASLGTARALSARCGARRAGGAALPDAW